MVDGRGRASRGPRARWPGAEAGHVASLPRAKPRVMTTTAATTKSMRARLFCSALSGEARRVDDAPPRRSGRGPPRRPTIGPLPSPARAAADARVPLSCRCARHKEATVAHLRAVGASIGRSKRRRGAPRGAEGPPRRRRCSGRGAETAQAKKDERRDTSLVQSDRIGFRRGPCRASCWQERRGARRHAPPSFS